MQAKFIRKLSENTSLFDCEPPMMFLSAGHGDMPQEPKPEFSKLIVAWSGSVIPGYQRVVLHAAHLLAGEDGISYGAAGSRILDGAKNHVDALEISGYTIDYSLFDAENVLKAA